MMSVPNFFIIGAPKCGTSMLFDWMSAHPDIGAAKKKELFYFMDADNPLKAVQMDDNDGPVGIHHFFSQDALEKKITMEATTHYLYQSTAINHLSQNRCAKVCVLLRDPAKRVMSSFEYTANNLARIRSGVTYDDINDRIQSEKSLYPDLVLCRKSAYVLERDQQYSRYSSYLKEWIRRLGKERVMVVISEELFADPRSMLKDIYQWLNIDPLSGSPSAERKNETYRVRSTYIHRQARRLAGLIDRFPGLKGHLKKRYMQLNKSKPTKSVSPTDYPELMLLRDAERNAMEEILGRPIVAWR